LFDLQDLALLFQKEENACSISLLEAHLLVREVSQRLNDMQADLVTIEENI